MKDSQRVVDRGNPNFFGTDDAVRMHLGTNLVTYSESSDSVGRGGFFSGMITM